MTHSFFTVKPRQLHYPQYSGISDSSGYGGPVVELEVELEVEVEVEVEVEAAQLSRSWADHTRRHLEPL
ncbi:hypothetical protein EYF80_025566 [Liparis tanakae]|uniref:Uncharacterized protein n=1 Tax=Liparis tanakae TaxID=230148 RepID=A0A4Z2HE91_9TELE|nr:hypothetical protein EYF80_025566 [Liparis tanakae]